MLQQSEPRSVCSALKDQEQSDQGLHCLIISVSYSDCLLFYCMFLKCLYIAGAYSHIVLLTFDKPASVVAKYPSQTNGIFYEVGYSQVRKVHCIYLGVTGYNFQIILYLFLWRTILSWQTVQTLMKCRILRHFIWVFTVCKSTHFEFSSPRKLTPCQTNNGNISWLVLLSKWVKVFRIIPEFRILRLTFHRKSASKRWILKIIIASLI